MKSRTSFCKLTPFKKDLTRFAPVWALYLIGILLVLFENGGYYEYDRFARNYLMEFIAAGSIINLIYAGICAVMLYGDLYNTRMCYSLHTMPQRRESWLLSHAAAAFSFSLVPNLVISAAMMLFLESYWYLALYWLLASTLQFVFYFGIASLSAFLTGNRFATLAVYAGLNFISMLVYAAIITIYTPMLTGVKVVQEPFMQLCPVVYQMNNYEYFLFEQEQIFVSDYYGYDYFYRYIGLGEGWGYMAIMGVVGLAAMGGAVLLYRKRHLECAGDFIAFPKLNAVACVIITLCVGMLFAAMGEWIFSSSYIAWLAVGVVVGYFGSLMLLERRVKVFRGKTFLGFGVLSALLVVSILLFAFDVFGIVRWVPEVEDVKSVTIANYNSDNNGYPGDYYYGNRISVEITEDAQIADIIEAHEDILQWIDKDVDGGRHYVVLTYELENGRTVRRAYNAPTSTVNYEILSRYFYRPGQVLGYDGVEWEDFVAGVTHMWFDGGEVMPDMYGAVLEALKMDCQEGYVNYLGGEDICYYVEYGVRLPDGREVWRNVFVQNGAENAIAVLKSPENLMGYRDLDSLIADAQTVHLDGEQIPAEDYEGLLTAVWQDCQEGNAGAEYKKEALCELYYEIPYKNGTTTRYLVVTIDGANTAAWLEANGY